MTSSALSSERGASALPAVFDWIVTRGMLCLFLLMPAAAVLIGYLLRLVPLPVAVYGVFVSFGLFTAWVSYRFTSSDDPDEPVRHLHRYALYALLPFAAFTLAQIPAFFAADVVPWQLWSELGSALTREPSTQLWSLAAGIVLYVLVGMGLVMSSYVLARGHMLLTSLAFLGLLVPALFVSLFSTFSVVGAQLGPTWYVTFWLASLVGAVAAWGMPTIWPWVWRVTRGPALVAVVTIVALLVTAPFAFAVERATSWQASEQLRIDHAAFDRITVEPHGPVVFAGQNDQTARYVFALRFGPRAFTTAAGLGRALDAGPVTVEGRLLADDATVAWCTGYAAKLASPNSLRDPAAFLAAAEQLNYIDVPVSCAGSASALPTLCGVDDVTVVWKADAALMGERTVQDQQFSGQAPTTLTFPAGSVCL
jgi:MFS family permease